MVERDGSEPVAPCNMPSTETSVKAADAARQRVGERNSQLWEEDSCKTMLENESPCFWKAQANLKLYQSQKTKAAWDSGRRGRMGGQGAFFF